MPYVFLSTKTAKVHSLQYVAYTIKLEKFTMTLWVFMQQLLRKLHTNHHEYLTLLIKLYFIQQEMHTTSISEYKGQGLQRITPINSPKSTHCPKLLLLTSITINPIIYYFLALTSVS